MAVAFSLASRLGQRSAPARSLRRGAYAQVADWLTTTSRHKELCDWLVHRSVNILPPVESLGFQHSVSSRKR